LTSGAAMRAAALSTPSVSTNSAHSIGKSGSRWTYTKRQEEIREGLKAKARERGLWNFWLTKSKDGYGLTTEAADGS